MCQDSSYDIQGSSAANAKIGPPQNKMQKWALNLKEKRGRHQQALE
jgi:hypothetical protein